MLCRVSQTHSTREHLFSLGPAVSGQISPAFFVSSAAAVTVHAPNRSSPPSCRLAASELRLSYASELKDKKPFFFLFLSLDGPGSLALAGLDWIALHRVPCASASVGELNGNSCTTETLTDVCLLPPGPEERGCVRQFHQARHSRSTLDTRRLRPVGHVALRLAAAHHGSLLYRYHAPYPNTHPPRSLVPAQPHIVNVNAYFGRPQTIRHSSWESRNHLQPHPEP